MRCLTNLKRTAFLGLLATMFIGTPAFGEINLPSAVELEKSIYFQNTSGEPVQLNPGIYDVEQNGENALNMVPVGSGNTTAIQAIPAGHEVDVSANTAHMVPSPDNNADKQHLVYVTPDGFALEAVGSYSGVFSRAALTWGETPSAEEADEQDPLTVSFDQATYFKTIGGDPKVLQPGDYEVALLDNGLILTPSGDAEGEAVTVESEALGTSTATIVPDFTDNPDLQLLMVATAGGQSIAAIGSHSGTFPRGLRSWLNKKKKAVVNKVKGAASKAKNKAKGALKKAKNKVVKKVRKHIKVIHGKAKKRIKRAIHAAKERGKKALHKVKAKGRAFIKKHGKQIKSKVLEHAKGFIKKRAGKYLASAS